MLNEKIFSDSPLSLEDIKEINDTQLSLLDRHHLRLLGHCLSCFKMMKNGLSSGPLPDQKIRVKWCLEHPKLCQDQVFIGVLLEEFEAAANQLEKLASDLEVTPLELTLTDLIKVSLKMKSS